MKPTVVSVLRFSIAGLFFCGGFCSSQGADRIKSFGNADKAGAVPHAGLMIGIDGALYGTTHLGGAAGMGTVFRLLPDGSDYQVLHAFTVAGDGANPVGSLTQGPDGKLFGTTVFGGSNRVGTVYSLATNGGDYTILHHFTTLSDGQHPYGNLILHQNGFLYGVCSLSKTGAGSIYRLSTDGSEVNEIYGFPTIGEQGGLPRAVTICDDGRLYGYNQNAGTGGTGVVYRVDADGTGYTKLANVLSSGLRAHQNGLLQAADGRLFGVTCYAERGDELFVVESNGGAPSILHTFGSEPGDGLRPDCRLIQGADGGIYGTTLRGGASGAGTIFRMDPSGIGYTVLHHFLTNGIDGRFPVDSLVQAENGRLYGVTMRGGYSDDGTVYSISTNGADYQRIWSFSRFAGDGQGPAGQLTHGADGLLYGTTFNGGTNNRGTFYRMAETGDQYLIAHHFGGAGDGAQPSGKLLQTADGWWYGTTFSGGISNCGTLFRAGSDGAGFQVLYNFRGLADGEAPSDALVQGPDSALYGTTAAGGTNGVGTVFKFMPGATSPVVLYTFLTNKVDGRTPAGGLLLSSDNFLYGTTEMGGITNGGTVFKLRYDGSEYSVLRHFHSNGVAGTFPAAELRIGLDGALYGATLFGGTSGNGTVFRMNRDGTGFRVIRNFAASGLEGREPGGLVQGGDGTLYGVSYHGGSTNGGTLFELSIDGSAFVVGTEMGIEPGTGRHPSGSLLSLPGEGWYGVSEGGGDLDAGTVYRMRSFPPAIWHQPQSVVSAYNGDASFDVRTIGSPTGFQWYYNGAPLPGQSATYLNLSGVTRENSGIYSVLVTNGAGSVVSGNASLLVQVPLRLSGPVIDPETSQLWISAGYVDDWPVSPDEVGRFKVLMSTNLVDWALLNNPFTISDGQLRSSVDSATFPTLYFQALEQADAP